MVSKKNTPSFSILEWSVFLIIFAVISMIAQAANFYAPIGISTAKTANFTDMLIGYAILYAGTVIGLILTKKITIGWPAVLWVSVVLIFVSMPWMPTHEFVIKYTTPVALLPMATPVLAYAGFAIAKNELQLFKKAGWKIIIVACLSFTGSYVASAAISNFVLKLTGQI
ncbi:MAG: hypothetical protein CSA34_07115 [Desulfobulbus propionicus]|nr:MAG: hypothetical protein CSA34_07115 [Desulfobulbus propionicus]